MFLNITGLKRAIHVFTKVIPDELQRANSELAMAAELTNYRTRSNIFDSERRQFSMPLNCAIPDTDRSLQDSPNDSLSSSCYSSLTPQFKIGSASCSTTPCCSTYCRNTPSAEDCSLEDYVPLSSVYVNAVEYSPAESVGFDGHISVNVPTNEHVEPLSLERTEILHTTTSDKSQISHSVCQESSDIPQFVNSSNVSPVCDNRSADALNKSPQPSKLSPDFSTDKQSGF